MTRKVWALLLALTLILSLAACGDGSTEKDSTQDDMSTLEEADTNTDQKTPDSSGPSDSSPESAPVQSEDFIQEVQLALDGQVGQGEEITSIEKSGDNLIIKVDMSGATNTHGIPLNLIAESRCSSITDAILELERDDQWETITIDFGELGSMMCGKGDIEENEYGRYISSEAITNSLK